MNYHPYLSGETEKPTCSNSPAPFSWQKWTAKRWFWDEPTPLKNDWVTWDDDYDEIPKYSQLFLESHNPFMFQSPPGFFYPKDPHHWSYFCCGETSRPNVCSTPRAYAVREFGPALRSLPFHRTSQHDMAFLDKGRGLERKTRKAAQMEGKAPKKLELTVWWTIFDEKKMIPSGYLT